MDAEIEFSHDLPLQHTPDLSGFRYTLFAQPGHQRYYLYTRDSRTGKGYILGVFATLEQATARARRHQAEPDTTVALLLGCQDTPFVTLTTSGRYHCERFVGDFGTAFSGYVVKADPQDPRQVMVHYTADYHSELLGVVDEETATELITQHYDKRRQRCLLC